VMPSLATRPLIAVSLAIPSVILLGYLWQKRRSEEAERCDNLCVNQEQQAIDSREVSLKLESLTRSRLDCIEEETLDEKSSQLPEDKPVMTGKEAVEVSSPVKDPVPDVFTALKDPIGSPLSSSPVKSESSESQRSSEAWSDLIEQDEQEVLDGSLCAKFSNLDIGENARHDSGVASPTEEFGRAEPGKKDGDNKSRISSGEDHGIGGSDTGDASDSGQGSELCMEETQILSYHFHIQDYLCGTFIGYGGSNIKKMKSDCNCNIILKDDNKKSSNSNQTNQKRSKLRSRDRRFGDGTLNLCIIEGTRTNIDKCLDVVKAKFIDYPELTLDQINKPESTNLSLYNGSVTLSLAEGIMHDVFISSVVNGGHLFVQQPAHPTFPALERLDSCMMNTYSQLTCPQLTRPILPNSICVASNNGGWYRCQVVYYDDVEDVCDVKYIDYGGYDTVPADSLRQIRTDFLTLPFQAIECYLANLILTEEDTVSSNILEELVAGQTVQARMIGLNEDGIPMIHLYRSCNGQTVMVNRELVDRSCADWIEATIVPLVPDATAANWNTLGDFNPSCRTSVMQIKHYENLTSNYIVDESDSLPQLYSDQGDLEPGPLQPYPGHYANSLQQHHTGYTGPLYASPVLHHAVAVEPDSYQQLSPDDPCPLDHSQPRPKTFFFGGCDLGPELSSLSPGTFLEPYPVFGVGPDPSVTYIQWSNSEF